MKIIGLTGGIGMGKSTAAKVFRRAGIPVFDADAAVHRLQAPGGAALPAIEAAFPGTVQDGVLDRTRLRAAVVGNEAAMKQLERIMHPRGAPPGACLSRPCPAQPRPRRRARRTLAAGDRWRDAG